MATATPVRLSVNVEGMVTVPTSIASDWVTVITAGGVSTQDAATITDPKDEIDLDTHPVFYREDNMGTILSIRVCYPTAATWATDPKFKVFGFSADDTSMLRPQILRNGDGDIQVEVAPAETTDAVVNIGGTEMLASTPTADTHFFDCQGCSRFIVGTEVAGNADSTYEATAILQAKIL
jgi:hypothetical protein